MLENDLKYIRLDNYNADLVQQVVTIHYDSLAYTSFLTTFGREFLMKLYEFILTYHVGYLLVALDNNRVIGFILYTFDTSKIFRLFFKKLNVFWKQIIGSVIKKPAILSQLLQTIFYPAKEGVDIKAELLVIAVQDEYRSKSIGSKLLKYLDNEMTSIGITKYKVTVLEHMERSNNFYRKLGFQLANTFSMYSQRWNLYLRELNCEKH